MDVEAITDYRALIKRELRGLANPSDGDRRAAFQRVRDSLATALRRSAAGPADDYAAREIAALEDAIGEVESELAPPTAPAPRGRSFRRLRVVEAGRKAEIVETPARRNAVDPTLAAILEFQRPSLAIVNAPIPRAARGIAWIVAALVASLIAIAGLVSVDQVVTAHGLVVSRSPTILVQPLETAIIRSIEVNEGQVVHAGQVLARLDPTFADADLGSLSGQVSALNAEVARLKAEASGAPFAYQGADAVWLTEEAIFAHRQAEFALRTEQYRHKLDELRSVVRRSESDLAGYGTREAVAQAVEKIRKELEAKQVGSRLNTLAAIDARAEIERAKDSATETLQSAKRELEALQSESDGFAQSWAADIYQKLADAERKLDEAREQLAKAQLRHSLVDLRAEQDGVVQSLSKVSVGSVLQSGQPFITIVPANSPLEVEANVPGSESGFVHVGDPVAIKFDTFPFAQYGMAEGSVATVSPNSFSAEDEARNPTGSAPSGPASELFYRARITLDHVALRNTPAGFRVIAGMPVSADIKVGRRTVLGYFLGKIMPIAEDGLREPQS